MADDSLVEYLHAEIVNYAVNNNSEKDVSHVSIPRLYLEFIAIINNLLSISVLFNFYFVAGRCVNFGVSRIYYRVSDN